MSGGSTLCETILGLKSGETSSLEYRDGPKLLRLIISRHGDKIRNNYRLWDGGKVNGGGIITLDAELPAEYLSNPIAFFEDVLQGYSS